jgi:hypothetical protein
MEFTYLKKKFKGDDVTIYSNGGIHLEVGDTDIVFKSWDEVREFVSRFEEINKEALLTRRRQRYGKDLIINYDEEEHIYNVFWRGRGFEAPNTLVRELPIILRFFLRRYHKLMLDYGTGALREGFEVDTGSSRYTGATNTGL